MIVMEKPKAIITNKALTLRLEMFLAALVRTPMNFTFSKYMENTEGSPELINNSVKNYRTIFQNLFESSSQSHNLAYDSKELCVSCHSRR